MRARIRRIRARSVFLLALVLYALVGLLIGGTLFVLELAHLVPAAERTGIDAMGAWILVFFPLLYGLIGGFFGAVAAILYNAVAALTGGVEVDLAVKEGKRESAPAEAPAPDQEAGSASRPSTASGS